MIGRGRRHHRGRQGVVVVPAGARGPRRRPSSTRIASPTRSTPSCWPGWRRRGWSRPPADRRDADPPGVLRPDRPAADARGGRRVRRRPVARRVRDAGRPAARVAAVRRAVGPALARRGPLRRDQRLRARRREAATPGATATTSSRRSTTTSPTTASSREQLAGDELRPTTPTTRSSPPASTGSGVWDDEPRRRPSRPSTTSSTTSSDTTGDGLPRPDASAAPAATTTSSTRSRRPTTTGCWRSSTASSRTSGPPSARLRGLCRRRRQIEAPAMAGGAGEADR